MKNLNHSTEHQLKNRLEEYEFDFDPQAWKSMNKMLNNHNPRRSPLWTSSLVIMTAFVTLLSVAWYVPLEPIQAFFKNVFDLEESTIQQKPTIEHQLFLEEEVAPFDLPELKVEPEIPTKIEKEIMPIIPLSPMLNPSLIPNQNQNSDHTEETTQPLASINSLLENHKEHLTDFNLPVKRKVTAGFFGGGSVSVSGSPLIPIGAISPSVGIFAGYNINDKWGIQAEVNFRKGFIQPFTPKEDKSEFLNLPIQNEPDKSSFDRVVANQDIVARNLTVLEFPVLAKYKVNEKNSLMAGVRPSWIHVKDPNADSSSNNIHQNAIYEKWDVGLTIGYEIQLTDRVAVNVRYNQGVTDLFDENDKTHLNSDFQASVRYSLNP